ncbi:hypothetical protein BDV96DRAFT_598152 [Lophiotrema nucula]|uniref:Uncharacterized protein n=1 Tax=Lophiotrema nucula TaxID=690887 RepID=A0A6A5ZCL6_9PLEO|nr:hypothetical protein BDV96DRAFT_598152 [Lophiotrema nucula]
MAEPPATSFVQNGNRPHGPSHLRHQVLPDSTDDDGAPNQDGVQMPDSDFCIEETQYGPDHHRPGNVFDGPEEEGLSPSSRAVLDNSLVSKGRSPVEPVPTPSLFLSRQTVGDGNQPPSPKPFAFQSFKSATSKPKVKPVAQAAVPVVSEATAENDSATFEQEDAVNEEEVPQSAQPTQRPTNRKHTRRPGQKTAQHVDHVEEQIQTGSMFASPSHEQSNALEVNLALPDTTADAQAAEEQPVFEFTKNPAPDIKRTKFPGKKGKKARKALQSRLPNGPLAPSEQRLKSLHFPAPSQGEEGILNVVPTAGDEPPSIDVADEDTAPIPEESFPPDRDQARPETRNRHASPVTDDQDLALGGEELLSHGLSKHVPQENEASRRRSRRLSASVVAPEVQDSALHGILSQEGSNRISKPLKSSRTGGNPHGRVGRSQPFMNRTPIDNLLESVRFSYTAEQVKTELTQKAITQAHNDALQALKDANVQYKCRIDTLEAAERELRTTLKQKSEAAKNLQKYVQGLSNDHVKFKATVKSHEESCKKALREKIQELESEKSSMVNAFHDTITHLEGSQRKLRAVVNECYNELQIVSARKSDLIKIVNDQHTLLERERQKCANLEEQIVDSLRTVLHRLEDDHEALLEKLESVQTSVERSNADDGHDDPIKECLENLRALRDMPFLTIKDVQKAEGMLRYVHERIDSKLGSLAESVDANKISPEEIQDSLYAQLQALKSEVLKYDEAKADYHKARQCNEHLNHQLQLQREQCERLGEQVQGLQLNEANLKARSSQLELELKAFKDEARDHESEPSELELEIAALRVQLKKAEEDVRVAAASLGSSEHLRQEQETAAVQMKERAEEAEAKLAKSSKKSKTEDFERRVLLMRREIEKDLQKKFQEKEATLANSLHRVTRERDENQQSMQAITRELEATNNVLHEVREELRKAESEIKSLQKDKAEAESKLKKAKRSPRKDDAITSEIADLKEQLKVKSAACEAKEAELSTARQQQTEKQSQTQNLQELLEKTKLQLSEQHATIESLRDQWNLRFSEQEEKHNTELQDAKDQVSLLQRQMREVESNLTQERRNSETQLQEAQSKHQLDKDDMERQLSSVGAAQTQNESELARVKKAAEEQLKIEEAKGRTEIEDLQRRLAQSDAALKESEAKVKRVQHESQQALAAHKDLTAKKYAELRRVQESTTASREHDSQAGRIRGSSQNQASRTSKSSILQDSPSTVPQNIHVAKPMMQVNRQDNSIRSVNRLVNTNRSSRDVSRRPVKTPEDQDNDLSDQFEKVDGSTDWLGALELLDESGVSFIDRAPDAVSETQEQPGISMDSARFYERPSQAAPILRSSGSSSELSPPDSDLINEVGSRRKTTPVRIDHQTDHRPVRADTVYEMSITTPKRPEYASTHGVHSRERPESRANSAVRMAPPSGSYSHRELASPHLKQSSMPARFERDSRNGSSPDFAHPNSTMTYSHHARPPSSAGHAAPTYRTPDVRSSKKRKTPGSSVERSSASKKARESLASLPSSMPFGAHHQTEQVSSQPVSSIASSQQKVPSGPSAISIRSKSVRGSSSQVSVHGSSSRPSRRTSTRINNMQDRFFQELR